MEKSLEQKNINQWLNNKMIIIQIQMKYNNNNKIAIVIIIIIIKSS